MNPNVTKLVNLALRVAADTDLFGRLSAVVPGAEASIVVTQRHGRQVDVGLRLYMPNKEPGKQVLACYAAMIADHYARAVDPARIVALEMERAVEIMKLELELATDADRSAA